MVKVHKSKRHVHSVSEWRRVLQEKHKMILSVNNFLHSAEHDEELKVNFSYRPPEGITRPAGKKEVEKSAERPNESSGEV